MCRVRFGGHDGESNPYIYPICAPAASVRFPASCAPCRFHGLRDGYRHRFVCDYRRAYGKYGCVRRAQMQSCLKRRSSDVRRCVPRGHIVVSRGARIRILRTVCHLVFRQTRLPMFFRGVHGGARRGFRRGLISPNRPISPVLYAGHRFWGEHSSGSSCRWSFGDRCHACLALGAGYIGVLLAASSPSLSQEMVRRLSRGRLIDGGGGICPVVLRSARVGVCPSHAVDGC